MGNGEVVDHMMWDGLTNHYDGKAMGVFGEQCVEKFGADREQDEFAAESVRRALAATSSGAFDAEIAPLPRARARSASTQRGAAPLRAWAHSQPAPGVKRDGGTITAASSSKISGGAAATVVIGTGGRRLGVRPLARIVAHHRSQAPEWFTGAGQRDQQGAGKAGWRQDQVDLFEIGEAFACVAMAPIRELGLDHAGNVRGGACALGIPSLRPARGGGHLIHALLARGGRRGVAPVHRRRRSHRAGSGLA